MFLANTFYSCGEAPETWEDVNDDLRDGFEAWNVPAPMMMTLMPVFGFAPVLPESLISSEDILGRMISSIFARGVKKLHSQNNQVAQRDTTKEGKPEAGGIDSVSDFQSCSVGLSGPASIMPFCPITFIQAKCLR